MTEHRRPPWLPAGPLDHYAKKAMDAGTFVDVVTVEMAGTVHIIFDDDSRWPGAAASYQLHHMHERMYLVPTDRVKVHDGRITFVEHDYDDVSSNEGKGESNG